MKNIDENYNHGMKMQIIIPMSGVGERFRKKGFQVPKPLIKVDGKPLIHHIVQMFPGEHDFIFICNRDHLESPEFNLRSELLKFAPQGRILSINPHKFGPAFAIDCVKEELCMESPTIVNYCDFCCVWDFAEFIKLSQKGDIAGIVACYTGFHPHMLRSTNFAYVKHANGVIEDIREKQSFTSNPINEFASSGTYYFRTGRDLTDACTFMLENDISVNSEFYISLAYKKLLAEKEEVRIFEIEKFMQWGTPEDLQDYNYYSEIFRLWADQKNLVHGTLENHQIIMPMAGKGVRFVEKGYETLKPMIKVDGVPMLKRSLTSYPKSSKNLVITNNLNGSNSNLRNFLDTELPDLHVITMDGESLGQASTSAHGLQHVSDNTSFTIVPCDAGLQYCMKNFLEIFARSDWDLIVWINKGYPNAERLPAMFGWVNYDGFVAKEVSVKKRPSDQYSNGVMVGTFTFRDKAIFQNCYDTMIKEEATVNGEYYIDTMVQFAILLNLRVRVFEVDKYLCWGSPAELETFEYWRTAFEKWHGHQYLA